MSTDNTKEMVYNFNKLYLDELKESGLFKTNSSVITVHGLVEAYGVPTSFIDNNGNEYQPVILDIPNSKDILILFIKQKEKLDIHTLDINKIIDKLHRFLMFNKMYKNRIKDNTYVFSIIDFETRDEKNEFMMTTMYDDVASDDIVLNILTYNKRNQTIYDDLLITDTIEKLIEIHETNVKAMRGEL